MPEIDSDVGEKAIRNFLDLWIIPEVERRGKLGMLPHGYVVNMAQVIFNVGEPATVRLNEEVRAVAHVKPAMKPGQAVYASDVEEITGIDLTDKDPNSGHVTIIFLNGKTHCTFNFNYNSMRISETLDAVQEFIDSAASSLERQQLRPFVESLWSAAELLAKAFLLWAPDENLLTSRKHGYIQSQFNLSGQHGNVNKRWVGLLNTITNLRHPARYLSKPLLLTVPEAEKMLRDARDWLTFIRANNPVRHPAD